MTQQFKFGDRVKCIPTPESIGVVLSEVDEYGYVNVMFDDALEVEDFPVSGLELIPHPDTVRLDWLIKRNFDFQKCYDMGGRWWYEDNSFDEIEGTEGMTEREAIDKVMEKETEK